MMRGNWNFISSSGRSEPSKFHHDLPLPVIVRPLRSARRLRLRLDERRGLLKLTCPHRMSQRAALAWAAEQHEWVAAQLASLLPAEPFAPGSQIPIHGKEIRLAWIEGASRTPMLKGNELHCGGPETGFSRRIETFLKQLALDTLSQDTAQIAATAGVSPRSVSVGDATTRWGSCSAGGRIRYSWRLILAPPEVRRYVVAHEVAHLAHLNHGPEFRTLEARLFGGDVRAARDLLRRVGPRLKRVGLGK